MDYQEVCFEAEVVKLPVAQDPVTGVTYVRLGDFHDIFPAVNRILLGDMIVPFMVGPNAIKNEPKRVPHYPGRILQLIGPALPAPSTPLPRYSAVDDLHLQHQHQEHPHQQPPQHPHPVFQQCHEEGPQSSGNPRQRALQRSQSLLRAIEEQLLPHGPHTVLPDNAPLIPKMLLRTTTSAARVVTNAPSATAPGRLAGPPVSPNLYQELQREIKALRQLIGQNHDEVNY